MPLVRIDMIRGRSPQQVRAVDAAVIARPTDRHLPVRRTDGLRRPLCSASGRHATPTGSAAH